MLHTTLILHNLYRRDTKEIGNLEDILILFKGENTMTEKEVFLTHEGLEKLEAELEESKIVKRKEVAYRIKEALDFGDISENAEYDQAKNEQAKLEERIKKIEYILRNSKLIEDEEISTEIVGIGSKVLVLDVEYDEEMEYTIVGTAEADPYNGKISNESPVGKALLGSKAGQVIDVNVPSGVLKYQIQKIAR
jgi:transcription elongation factor GreA